MAGVLPHWRAGRSLYAQTSDRGPSERVVQTADHELRHQLELLRPDRRPARDGDHAIALARGLALGRERVPRGRRPRPLDLGEQRGRCERRRRAREREAPTGPRRARRLMPRPRLCAAAAPRPGETASRPPPVVRPGHVRKVGRRDHALAAARGARWTSSRGVGVELAHHVIEQHQRRRPAPRASASRSASSSASRPRRCWPREP